jgi:hypothetical protein
LGAAVRTKASCFLFPDYWMAHHVDPLFIGKRAGTPYVIPVHRRFTKIVCKCGRAQRLTIASCEIEKLGDFVC